MESLLRGEPTALSDVMKTTVIAIKLTEAVTRINRQLHVVNWRLWLMIEWLQGFNEDVMTTVTVAMMTHSLGIIITEIIGIHSPEHYI